MVFDNRLVFADLDYRKEYTGDCMNGQIMHGEGVLTLKSGRVYRGTWISGAIEAYTADLQEQELAWNAQQAQEQNEKQAKLEVQKARKQEKQTVYNELQYYREHNFLAWVAGLRLLDKLHQGSKTIQDHNGVEYEYEGELDKQGQACGQGIARCSDGHSYTGTFLSDKMHGIGVIRYKDGSVEQGRWQDGHIHGKTTLYQ